MKKHFNFKLYISTSGNQNFLISSFGIDALNLDEAIKIFSKRDLPFHHYHTITEKTIK